MIRDLDDKGLGQNSDSSLSPLSCCLFLVTSSLSPHLARFLAYLFADRPCFRLRGSMGLAVGLAIKWPAALPFSAAGPSC